MFDNLVKKLKDLKNCVVKISMLLDEKGHFDRMCPSSTCGNLFKVLFDDWLNIVKNEIVYCPICRFEAPATDWNTPSQAEYIREHSIKNIQEQLSHAIKKDVKNFNRKQKPSIVSMSLSYKPRMTKIPIPAQAAKELQQSYHCITCGCHFSLLGIGYFCPACGKNIAFIAVNDSLRNIENFIKNYSMIKKLFADTSDKEVAEKHIIQITEEHYTKIVSLLQHYSEYLFKEHPESNFIKVRKNLFQNLAESSAKWKELTGCGYEDIIPRNSYSKIKLHFQRRHLLIHTNGIVDESYISKTNDTQYLIGQRLVINKKELENFLKNAYIFIREMKKRYSN